MFYFIVVCFFLLSLRLVKLQLIDGPRYGAFSQRNSLRRDKVPGPRGLIFDREGKLLVDNRLKLDVAVTPQFVNDPEETVSRIAEIAGLESDKLIDRYKTLAARSPRFQSITLVPNADRSVVAQIESSRPLLSGVNIETRLQRTYLHGEIGAQVYGYINEVTERDIQENLTPTFAYQQADLIGRAGIERQFERYLRGRNGVRHVVVNAHGHRAAIENQQSPESALLNIAKQDVEPESGHNLTLTIDADLQEAAWEAMEGQMGATVALDPQSGQILALVSKPSYDATLASLSEELWQGLRRNKYGPLRNKAIQDHFSPGSTFKIFTALTALDAKLISPSTTLTCPPVIWYGRRPYHEHNQAGFGEIEITEAIQRSSNVFLWQLAMKLDVDQIAKVATSFGLGQKTGVDLPGEIPGLIPTKEWKERTTGDVWFPGETLSVAIGQGATLVTPLQLAVSYAAVANGGLVFQPYIVSKVSDVEGNTIEEYKPRLTSKVADKVPDIQKIIKPIQEGIYKVVNERGGTAYWHGRSNKVKIAGKSGTVQVLSDQKNLFKKCNSKPFEERHHGFFAGYAPFDNPEIVVVNFNMHGCGGSVGSSPIVKAVIEKWWKKREARRSLEGPQPQTSAR